MHKHTHPLFNTLAAAAFTLAAGAASAQQVGNYVGSTADGHDFNLTVSQDENGALVLTGLGVGFTALCAKSGQSQEYGIGAGANVPLTGNSVSSDLPYSNLWASISATFDGAGNVTGKVTADIPLYVDSSVSFKSENCSSGKKKFSAVLTAAEAVAHAARPLPAGQATVTARPAAR